jgi:hypothetical protein
MRWQLNVPSISSPSAEHHDRSFNLNDPKIGIGIAVLANLLQVAAVLVQSSDELRSFLFLVSLLGGGSLILWAGDRWPKSRAPLYVFVIGTLAAAALLIWTSVTSAERPQTQGESPPPTYYIRLSAYAFDTLDGTLDLDQPLSEIPIVIRDQYKHSVMYKTRRNGALALLQSYGKILIGACGLYHSQTLGKENDTAATALVVQIGIDASRLRACKE